MRCRAARLRGLYVAGAPLDPTLKATIEQEFGLPLLNGYGITECAPGISGVRADAPRSGLLGRHDPARHRGASGRAATARRSPTARSASCMCAAPT